MYSLLTNNRRTQEQEAAELFDVFKLLRQRLQQIVVLLLATSETELHLAAGDILVKMMKEAGDYQLPTSSVFSSASRMVLSRLDQLIVDGLKVKSGNFEIGNDHSFFTFKLQQDHEKCVLVETLNLRNPGSNPRFTEIMTTAMLSPPPVLPVDNLALITPA